jgi:hypothetical protein
MALPAAPGGQDRWPPTDFYRCLLWTVTCLILGASFLVIAVVLYSSCVPVVTPSPTVSTCVYPYWGMATFFFVGAALFLVLAGAIGYRATEILRPHQSWFDEFPPPSPVDIPPPPRPVSPTPVDVQASLK